MQAEIETLKSNSENINKDDIVLFYTGSFGRIILNLTKNKILDAEQSLYLRYNESKKELLVTESPSQSPLTITFNDIYPFYTGTYLANSRSDCSYYNHYLQEKNYSVTSLLNEKLIIKSPSGQTYEIKVK